MENEVKNEAENMENIENNNVMEKISEAEKQAEAISQKIVLALKAGFC